MPVIGVRELREHTTEVLRLVQEQGAEYVITLQGQPVACLSPVNVVAMEDVTLQVAYPEAADGWMTYAHLAEDVRQKWPAHEATQDVLDAMRR